MLLLPALFAAGCAENAILELSLDLPPTDGIRQYAFLQARSGEPSFEDTWSGDGSTDGLALAASGRTDAVVSIEASADQADQELRVKLHFCTSQRCTALADGSAPEVRIRFGRAFYVGEYTTAEVMVDSVPASGSISALDVDHCLVGGCRAGETSYYCRADGTHFCE